MSEASLWKWFSIFIRLRDAAPFTGEVKCFTCSRIKPWRQVDCGHGIGRQHKATKYNERNNHGQCKHCNAFEAGSQAAYKTEMDKRYGAGTWDRMLIASRVVTKRGRIDFEIMTAFYKREAVKMSKEKNLPI